MMRTDIETVGRAVEDCLNACSHDPGKELARYLTGVHRTLQQAIFRMFVECLKIWADEYKRGRYDARNEVTCKLSSEILEKVRDLDAIPFI
jgi:hypothetical protein